MNMQVIVSKYDETGKIHLKIGNRRIVTIKSIEKFVIEDACVVEKILLAYPGSQLVKDLNSLISHFDGKPLVRKCNGCNAAFATRVLAYSTTLRLSRWCAKCNTSFLAVEDEHLCPIASYRGALYYVDGEIGERSMPKNEIIRKLATEKGLPEGVLSDKSAELFFQGCHYNEEGC